MWLQKISLLNFKNYAEAELNFSPIANAFTGNNGAGKTNLLDAIYYLSLCKSYLNPIDAQHIRKGTDYFMIQGHFSKLEQGISLTCVVKKNQKKQFRYNKKEYQRLADHIGLFPLVMISPYDVNIIEEGSEERRKFIDNAISQTDPLYLEELIRYNKYLTNRNVYLKQIAKGKKHDPILLDIFDHQLVTSGTELFKKRQAFMKAFVPVFEKSYQQLTESAEQVELCYCSQLEENDFLSILQQSIERDQILERTTVGVHKDDLTFTIHGMPMKKFGSQGQQKSFLIALKLAQYHFLLKKKGFKPLLLLDDIFDKLDEKRTQQLMELVANKTFGQIFITDTSSSRIKSIFNAINVELKLFQIEAGQVQ